SVQGRSSSAMNMPNSSLSTGNSFFILFSSARGAGGRGCYGNSPHSPFSLQASAQDDSLPEPAPGPVLLDYNHIDGRGCVPRPPQSACAAPALQRHPSRLSPRLTTLLVADVMRT